MKGEADPYIDALGLKGAGDISGFKIYSDDTYSPYKGTNHHTTTDELDVTAELAAPGYTVTRSARIDYGSDIYICTYTVKPVK